MVELTGVNTQAMRIFTNEVLCDERPTQLLFTMDFTAVDEYTGNLKNLVIEKKISAVRAIFFDNSRNSEDVVMSIENTNQTIVFPANTQGYMPVIMNLDITFALRSTSVGPTQIFKINLLNFMVQPFIWNATI